MGHIWMHIGIHGEHGPHVDWKVFGNFLCVKCLMGINRNEIPHYLSSIQHQFWVCFLYIYIYIYTQNLVEFWFYTYLVLVFVFSVSQLRFGTKIILIFVLVKKYRRLSCFRACDTKLFNPKIFLVILSSFIKWHTLKLLERFKCKSQSESNERKKKWGTLLSSQHL
jgi:hypothetical protein